MVLTKEQIKSFEEAARPMMKWLNDNCHPHTEATVTQTNAALSEGVCIVGTFDFVKD